MKKSLFLWFGFSAFFLATAAFGQLERILIPVVANRPIAGAFESQWVTEISGRYEGSDRLRLYFPVCPHGITCVYGSISPGSTFGSAALVTSSSPHGAVLTTSVDTARDTILAVRVRDLSRSFQTWGTELPVARESKVTDTAITLLNLPNSARFRVMIRMYDFDGPDNVFIATVLPLQGETPLVELALPAKLLRDDAGFNQGIYFAVLGDLELPTNAPERVRVVIRTQTPTKFWAFAAVTNNETQHVTAISPTRAFP